MCNRQTCFLQKILSALSLDIQEKKFPPFFVFLHLYPPISTPTLPVGSCTPAPECLCFSVAIIPLSPEVEIKVMMGCWFWRKWLEVCGEGWVCAHGVSSLCSGLRGRGAIKRRGLVMSKTCFQHGGPVVGLRPPPLRILSHNANVPILYLTISPYFAIHTAFTHHRGSKPGLACRARWWGGILSGFWLYAGQCLTRAKLDLPGRDQGITCDFLSVVRRAEERIWVGVRNRVTTPRRVHISKNNTVRGVLVERHSINIIKARNLNASLDSPLFGG